MLNLLRVLMPNNNSLITLLGTDLTSTTNVGREVERPTNNQVIEKKINYQILYKMVESAVEEILLEYPNDPVVDELKTKIINNLKPVIKQILPND